MTLSRIEAGTSGRIKSLDEVHNFVEFIEFILPYGLAKVYMTANRRWSFLEKPARKKALSLMINVVMRRFAFNIWDVRTSNGRFVDEFHTSPIYGIIDVVAREYASQLGLIRNGATLSMALFKLNGSGVISNNLKHRIDRLTLVMNRQSKAENMYQEASLVLYTLEEELIRHHENIIRQAISA